MQNTGSKSSPEYGTRFWRFSVVTCCFRAAVLPIEDTTASIAF